MRTPRLRPCFNSTHFKLACQSVIVKKTRHSCRFYGRCDTNLSLPLSIFHFSIRHRTIRNMQILTLEPGQHCLHYGMLCALLTVPDATHFQPCASNEVSPLLLTPLHATKTHHVQILQRHIPRCIHIRERHISNQDPRMLVHSIFRFEQDFATLGLIPVMKYATEVVNMCT